MRLQGELREQQRTRLEALDERWAALEWAREAGLLACQEARAVLTREALLAGDYDAQVCWQWRIFVIEITLIEIRKAVYKIYFTLEKVEKV